MNECGPGYINDPSNHVCLPCREGCLECSNSVTNCTVCDKQGKTPLFFDFDCLNECPKDVSILNTATFICEDCNPNCRTCAGTTSTCASCEDYKRLDLFTRKCVDACKPEVQIYDKVNAQCVGCDETCGTCAETTSKCATCAKGLVLNMDSTCRDKCVSDASGEF